MSPNKIILAVLLFVGLTAQPVWAHKVVASVYASGEIIEGEIGFSNGDPAVNALVEVSDVHGNSLGETTTDEDGMFTFRPRKQVEHVFYANLGAGHVAKIHMPLEELPPGIGGGSDTASEVAPSSAASLQTALPPGDKLGDSSQLRSLIAEEIRREIRPLQKELATYREKNDLQSILGGIGYILGLFGISFYVAARRGK